MPVGRGALIGVMAAVCAASAAAAQTPGTVVGLSAGVLRNEQVWSPEATTSSVDGMVLGLYADVPTRASVLRVLAEGAYTERGGDVVDEPGTLPGRVRARSLTVGVLLQLGASAGPVHVRIMAGPSFDQVLSSRLDAQLGQFLEEEGAYVFGATAGAAVGVGLGGWQVDVDVRVWEGLGDAYSGGFRSFRNRSLEGRLRVGVPLARLRGG